MCMKEAGEKTSGWLDENSGVFFVEGKRLS